MYKFILLGSLFLFGCSAKSPSKLTRFMEDSGKPKVLSTTSMIDDLVQEIGGDRFDTLTLIRGETDPHTYELVKGDDEKFERADLVIANGLGLEHGASLSYQIKSHKNTLYVGEAISKDDLIFIDGQTDPHIWMDVHLWLKTIDPITQSLIQLDPASAPEFELRAKKLKDTMAKMDEVFKARMHTIPRNQRYLITTHDAFNYFTKCYMLEPGEEWTDRCISPEGLAPDGQLTIGDIKRVVNFLQKTGVRVLFTESNVNYDSLRKIAEVSKHRGHTVEIAGDALLGDSMGKCAHYLDMIEHNVSVLEAKLK